MAGKSAKLGWQARGFDYLSVGLLSRLLPPSLVDEVLTTLDRHSKRQRDLPAHAAQDQAQLCLADRGFSGYLLWQAAATMACNPLQK